MEEKKGESHISPRICCRYGNILATCVTLCAQKASKNLPTCVRAAEISRESSASLQDLSASGGDAFHPARSML